MSRRSCGLLATTCAASIFCLLISPPCRRQAVLSLERPAECLVRTVTHILGHLRNCLAGFSQVALGDLEPPDGQITDRWHADEGCEAIYECAARHRYFSREGVGRPRRADVVMNGGQGTADLRIRDAL